MDAIPAFPLEIEVEDLKKMISDGADMTLLDVRETHERAVCALDDTLHIPMDQVPANAGRLAVENPLVVICHHGMRSLRVMSWLRENGFTKATSLRGGMNAWAQRVDPAMATY